MPHMSDVTDVSDGPEVSRKAESPVRVFHFLTDLFSVLLHILFYVLHVLERWAGYVDGLSFRVRKR